MEASFKLLLDVGFAKFELYDTYLIATVGEGVVLGQDEMRKFHEVFDTYYSDRPFGYISNRINDYTINPVYYKEIENYNINLVAVATLCYSEDSFKMANFAEQFFQLASQSFFYPGRMYRVRKRKIQRKKIAGL